MTRSTNLVARSHFILIAALAASGCVSELEGGGTYPLAAASPCDLAEGAACDLATFTEACALAADFDVACRCVEAGDGTGVVVCDGRTPVPPSPALCGADVGSGAPCADDEAGRVCGLDDGTRCICGSDDTTDPAARTWHCETPGGDACPRGTEAGAVCVGHEGTYCSLGHARCRCIDDPLRDGLTVWECEVPIGGGPTACDDTVVIEGDRCEALGETCEREGGRSCVCAYAVDGSRDLTTWQCEGPAPIDPAYCPDAVSSGELVECREIGARCSLPDGSGYCACVESPAVPPYAVGYWECVGTPPPSVDTAAD